MEPQIRYAKTPDGVNIAYYAVGNGPPFVWMPLPPYSHTGFEWRIDELRPLFDGITRRLTFIRYDTRGFALSDRGPMDYSVHALALDLEAVANAAGADTFILLANSMMAAPAIAFAARHPERLRALVLMDGLARGADFAAGWDAVVQLARIDWPFAVQTLARAVPGYNLTMSLEMNREMLTAATSQDAFLALFEGVKRWDVWNLVEKVTTPALVTHNGEMVPHIPMDSCRRLAASLPNGSFVSWPRTAEHEPHFGMHGMAVVGDFLARTVGSGQAREGRGDTPAPSPFRTVLFTDLVRHTEIMQRLGDARGRELLREHERITRDTLRKNGGTEVKTMGDGFMASFGSVTQAMDCAIALQRAFAAHTESTPEPLHVRVGLNAGEPIEENGDLFGSTVILASRIAAKAAAGEILIPEPLRHLLTGKSYVYADRGETLLKGFEDAVRLYEVRWRE